MADFDLTTGAYVVPQEQNLVDRTRQFRYRIDFSQINSGSGLAATETAKFAEMPAGLIITNCIAILRTAEGAATTVDIGISGDADGLLDGGNTNGTANVIIAKAGTETMLTSGYYCHTATDLELLCPAAATTIDDALIDVIIEGFMVVTS